MTEESPDTRGKLRQRRLVRHKPGGGNSAYQRAPRLGVRNNVAADLTGIAKPTISSAARRGKFERLSDGSYHTEQFEAWMHGRGDREFRVPDGLRGTMFDDEAVEEVHAVVVHPGANGASGNGHVTDASIYTLEQELIELRVQTERTKLESLQLKLCIDRGEYVPISKVSKTISDAIVQFRETMRRLGAELAPSLVGIDDEYDAKRRVDEAVAAALKRLQDRIDEAMGE